VSGRDPVVDGASSPGGLKGGGKRHKLKTLGFF